MNHCIALFPVALYFVVGLISLVMAFKSLFARKFLPFHESAAKKSWNDLDKPLQSVVITLLRISGLGFLVVGLVLIVFPIVNIYLHDIFAAFAIPGAALVYCIGLFRANFNLYKQTGTETPWKGSLAAAGALVIGIILSILSYL
ncbi:MAG TPA: hypothetical protein VKF42_04880 [Chitinivibrionales bacterium]|jgi:hypothetical protein|nr:hypothetical protein [Chitinivibrionales bacterium]